MVITKQPILDTAAILMAVICGAHCLLTPLLLVFLPVLTDSFWMHESFHRWMFLLAVPTTVFATYMGCKKYRNRSVLILSTVGVTLLLGGLFLAPTSDETACCPTQAEALSDTCSEVVPMEKMNALTSFFSKLRISTESIWTSLGGLFLATAHLRNFLLCRRSCCDPIV